MNIVLCRRTLFKVASVFVNLSETMADFGFLVHSPSSADLACGVTFHSPNKQLLGSNFVVLLISAWDSPRPL